jgi:phosphate transport system substrate-binding protein
MHLRWTKRIVALSFAALHVAAVHGQPREQVVIDGARAVMPLAMALAKEFEIRVRDVGFVFETDLGSEARLEAVIQGKLDIAVATNSLDLAYVSREGMAAHQIARTAVVFAVNSGVPVSNLTRRQICDVYNGLVSNWNSLGGPDLAIAPHSPPGNQVDAQIVRAAIQCLRGLRRTEAVKVIGQPRGMAKALASTRGAIGITSPIVVEESAGGLRSLAIDGVAPSADNVESRRYRMIRQTFFVTWSPPSPAVGRFLRFVRSSEGDKLIRVNGAVPAK